MNLIGQLRGSYLLLVQVPAVTLVSAMDPVPAGDGLTARADGDVLEALVATLSAPDPNRRAESAYQLGQLRAAALPVLPDLLRMLHDDARVPRRVGRTSRLWGRPSENRATTSPAEEAIKAILYIGRPALESFEAAVLAQDLPADHDAIWALELLREFD